MGAKSSHFVKVPKDLNDIKQPLQLYAESTRRTDCFLMRFLRT